MSEQWEASCPKCEHEFTFDVNADVVACPKCNANLEPMPETSQDGEGGSSLYWLLEESTKFDAECPKCWTHFVADSTEKLINCQCGAHLVPSLEYHNDDSYWTLQVSVKMPGTCFLQLASNGDLAGLSPVFRHYAERGPVYVITTAQYVPMLEVMSYVTPVVVDIPIYHPMVAKAWAEERYENVIVSQCFRNETEEQYVALSYDASEWQHCGVLEHFHDWPTVLDRRDREGEAAALAKHLVRDGRPLLVYNLNGASQPYRHESEQRKWIESAFPAYQTFDLGALQLDKVHHLLAFIEVADLLISVDTVTVHLARVTDTPTIVFWPEQEFARSERRNHWVYACTHDESVDGFHRKRMLAIAWNAPYLWWQELGKPGLLRSIRSVEAMRTNRVFHVILWDHERLTPEILKARHTWDLQRQNRSRDDYHIRFFEPCRHMERSVDGSPYMRDLIDFACEHPACHDTDIVVWTANDYCISSEFTTEIRGMMDGESCGTLFKGRVSKGFMFNVGWWKKHREEFPDVAMDHPYWVEEMESHGLIRMPASCVELAEPVVAVCYSTRGDNY